MPEMSEFQKAILDFLQGKNPIVERQKMYQEARTLDDWKIAILLALAKNGAISALSFFKKFLDKVGDEFSTDDFVEMASFLEKTSENFNNEVLPALSLMKAAITNKTEEIRNQAF